VKVCFELSPRDIGYFRDRLERIRAGKGARDEETVIRSAAKLVREAVAAEPPEFVRTRLVKLEQLIAMLRDGEWRLEGRDRARVLDALAYFVDPDDLIPDRVPGIGYLDDAIMVELVVQELKHEIGAYEDFCVFREDRKAATPDVLESRRQSLQARMRRRQRSERQKHRDRSRSARSPLRLW
jgi:uncharacterized membrane protein YkvA (DUF1232 family)